LPITAKAKIAEALGCAHELGGDDEHPAEAKARAQRDHIGRQHRRQKNSAYHLRTGQPEGAANLDDLAVNRHHSAHDAEINRKKHADRDQGDFGSFEYSEPQDEQRCPGNRRHRAQALQAWIDEPAHQRRISRDRPEQSADDCPHAKSDGNPQKRRDSVAHELARACKLGELLIDARRRRHQAAIGDARAHRQFPTQGKGQRQNDAERRPRVTRQRRPGPFLFRRGFLNRHAHLHKRHQTTH
jgi:hypothetical protein